jgi:hypothetical protein
MRTLTLIQTCTEEQHDYATLNESSMSFEWRESPLQVDDLVSLGSESRWRVVRTQRYEPINLNQPLNGIDFVEVCLDAEPVPDREIWSTSQLEGDEYPFGVVPGLGEAIERVGVCFREFEIPFYSKSQYDCYKPAVLKGNYAAIYLVWEKVLQPA